MTVQAQTKTATLVVIYNGVDKPLEFNPRQAVQAILQHAIQLFGVTQQPHLLSLFREDGTKVEEPQSAEDAGLREGTKLYLRPDQVKGG